METEKAKFLITSLLGEIKEKDGAAATEKFPSLRSVDAKVREARAIFEAVPGLPPSFVTEMDANPDFKQQSRRVRLETLTHYCNTALKFLASGGFDKQTKQIVQAPDLSKLTAIMPNLEDALKRRWIEAQKCNHFEAHLAAVILMGSILEGLLLARAQMSPSVAYQATKAPRDKNGKSPAIHDWNLNTLIDVAAEVGWIKTDRGKFSHALRESRNVVHPWLEVSSKANFDGATTKTCWEVLKASVDDLIKSAP